jgi:uncharacterized glyoxalase superfamily protein PhnB
MSNAPSGPSTVMPSMRYRDAPAAIEWLCKAFGFEKRMVIPNPDGTIAHAELTFGNGMIMLGTGKPEFATHVKTPSELGGTTQSAYIVAPNIEAHYKRAGEAGAVMVMPLENQGYGTIYVCKDPEGHMWCFGNYDPWAPQPESA